MRRLGILLVLLPVLAGAQVVRELGPAPIVDGPYTGRVSAIACASATTYYVGGADGGVWKTTDAGLTWRPLTDQLPTTAVGAIALDPTDPETLYVGTGEANYANHSRYGLGIFKSTDGGRTWAHYGASTFAGRCFSRLVVDPVTPSTVYAAITPAGGFPEKAGAKNHPLKDGPLGVFRSTDGGVTWTRLAGGLPNQAATDLAIHPTSPNTLYAAIGRPFGSADNGVYRTTNGGATWTKLAGGLPTSGNGRISLAIAPSNPNRLYALIVNPCDAAGNNASTRNAYRTNDGGDTWTALNPGNFQATYGWFLSVVTVDPTNPDRVMLGGYQTVRSTNAGASWSNVTPPHVDSHALEWDSAGRLLHGTDGGVYRSTDFGANWFAINGNLGLIQCYAGVSSHPSNPGLLLIGTQDNGSSLAIPGGRTWDHVTGGDGGWTQIDQTNPLRMFTESQGSGNLYRSINGGVSFSDSGSGIASADRHCFLPPYVIDPTNSQRMLYATHRIYRSTNGGSTWAAISGDVTGGSGAVRSLAMARSNPQVVYLTTNDGRFSVSTDGGVSFTVRLTGRPGWPRVTREIFVAPTSASTVYLATAAFGVDQVRRSTDSGATWTTLDGDLPDVPVNTIAVDESTSPPTLYAGADDGLYASRDGGVRWHRFGYGLPRAPVIDVLVEPARHRLIVATQGRGVFEVGLRRTVSPP